MIQEYRKATAEKLKFYNRPIDFASRQTQRNYYSNSELVCSVDKWKPDKDANQMLMVWDSIRNKSGSSTALGMIWHSYLQGEDIKLATMKTFMKTI